MTVYEVVIEGRQGANDMLNVVHYDDGGTPPADWGDVTAVLEGHLEDHLQLICGPRVTWLGLTYRIDTPGSVGVFEPLPGGVLAGTNAEEDQLDQLAVLIRKRSTGAVRPVLGWAFQGGITAHGMDGAGRWSTAIVAEATAFWEDIRVINIAGPSTLQMVIKASNPTAPNTQPYSSVNTITSTTVPRTLRRRREAVGS
jgi:hypothetical protein